MDLTLRVENLEEATRELKESAARSAERFQGKTDENSRQIAVCYGLIVQTLQTIQMSSSHQARFEVQQREAMAAHAAAMAAHDLAMVELDVKLKEATDKLNGVIAVVDDMIRRKT